MGWGGGGGWKGGADGKYLKLLDKEVDLILDHWSVIEQPLVNNSNVWYGKKAQHLKYVHQPCLLYTAPDKISSVAIFHGAAVKRVKSLIVCACASCYKIWRVLGALAERGGEWSRTDDRDFRQFVSVPEVPSLAQRRYKETKWCGQGRTTQP